MIKKDILENCRKWYCIWLYHLFHTPGISSWWKDKGNNQFCLLWRRASIYICL